MNIFLSLVFFSASVIFFYMSFWFVVSILTKRNDVADIAWGLGFITVLGALIVKTGQFSPKPLLVLFLTTLWGLRLAIHILIRNKGKKEDSRYLQWRKDWGKFFLIRTYLQVFLLQGVFMLMISLSAITVCASPFTSLWFLDFIGIIIWSIGFFFESVGDWQLALFKKNPDNKGKIMDRGLWRFTRHPNYFGEVTQWWGIFLIVALSPLWFIALISPLTISWLLLWVSGIPLLEKKYEGSSLFEKYKQKTSPFFPWFPKKIN